jgi:DNA-binding NarL/FixJ family response regulator
VIVLDIGMPELKGIEAARRLAKSSPGTQLVFVTQHLDRAYVHAAFAAGARAYVAKQSAAKELMEAISMALADRYYVSPLVGGEAGEIARAEPRINPVELFRTRLTPRQREVLQLVAEGK